MSKIENKYFIKQLSYCDINFQDVVQQLFVLHFRFFIMDKNIEQRICLKFCASNGFSCAKSLKMLEKAYGDVVLSKTRAYEWYKAFKDGREVVEDLPRSGRPSKSSNEENIDKIKTMVLENRHLSLREIARGVNMSHESVRGILVDILGMRRINGDDKWMYENEKETIQNSSEFCSENEPKPKKPRRSRSEK